jgi:hypothetical protein
MQKTNPQNLKVPLVGHLPEPDARVFDNSTQEKPVHKLAKLDVKFGQVDAKNYEQLRLLNYMNLPVIYSEKFYDMINSMRRYSTLGYVKDVLVGAISCKEDTDDDGSKICYIMTITVL